MTKSATETSQHQTASKVPATTKPSPATKAPSDSKKSPANKAGAASKAPTLHQRETPSDYIPGLYTLGTTYNVLTGKYADSKSTLQQVVNWDLGGVRTQEVRADEYGSKSYSIPKWVNYSTAGGSDYLCSHGKTTLDYSKSLAASAGLEADLPGFSASASADYSQSERENLANDFTRVYHIVTTYSLSLPVDDQIRQYLKTSFVHALDNMDPPKLYKEYGTHLLCSLIMGGRAAFLFSTDTRSYSSKMTIDAAASLSAHYLVTSGKAELSVDEKQAMDSFNESSRRTIVTRGGDPRYGNEELLDNVSEWAGSVSKSPEFIDFGSKPRLIPIWQFATTQARRDALKKAYAQFVNHNTPELSLAGPYLRARFTKDVDTTKNTRLSDAVNTSSICLEFPRPPPAEWYWITPGQTGGSTPIIVTEVITGALAPVTWEEIYHIDMFNGETIRVWRAVPPTSDYIAMGCICMRGIVPEQPPEKLAGRFRAVHKRALTKANAAVDVTWQDKDGHKAYLVDKRYWFSSVDLPLKGDTMKLNPNMVKLEGDGW